MVDLKTRFYKTIADLPLSTRDDIAVVVDEKPLSWNVMKIEVDCNTEVGKNGLKILDKLKFLKS